MVIGRILKALLGAGKPKPKRLPTRVAPGITVEATTSHSPRPSITAAEYAGYLEKHRRDEAARAWRKNPNAYQPIRKLSTDPACPYCRQSLGNRKPPPRRSKFGCKTCGNVVVADPWHRIFPSCYLNAKQGLIARYLGMLDKAVGTAGKSEDFWWAAQQRDWLRGKNQLTDGEAADTLWTLMNYNVTATADILPPEERENFRYHADDLQRLMREYRKEEKLVNAELKSAKAAGKGKGRANAKIELECPNCGESLGKVAKPSRRSNRKCKVCGQAIHVDPRQRLFKSAFLTEKQAYLADTLDQLDHWVFTRGTIQDFNRVKKSVGKSGSLNDGEVAEVLRALIVENMAKAKADAEKEHQAYEAMTSDIDEELRASGINWPLRSDGADDSLPRMVEDLLTEFDDTMSVYRNG